MNINIKDRSIGDGCPAFIIAELSANHNQNFKVAVDTIKAIKEAGADAVKIQTYTADTITLDCDNEYFQIKHGTIWDGQVLHQLYKEAFTPWEWQPELKKIAEGLGLIFFSSPFDKTAVDFLEKMDVPAYKVASFEITDLPLIEYMASKKKPIIISTGVGTLSDIKEAVDTCRNAGNDQVVLLKCTSTYPAKPEGTNLLTIPDMITRFKVLAGLSDHSMGIAVPVAAVSLGAKIIEKHFIMDRKIGGPDAEFSTEPDEFADMLRAIRDVEKALGKIDYELSEKSKKSREFCRSLFIVEDIKKGEAFTEKNIRSIRPGHGLPPKHMKELLGLRACEDIKRGNPLRWEMTTKTLKAKK